jgi:hypothetical protein
MINMGDLSEHFDKSEFACHCGCGNSKVNPELVEALEQLRAKAQAPVRILSGKRCKQHNDNVGGATLSQHLLT